jgi:glycosyltransferase involved in cell wall biosynthesis
MKKSLIISYNFPPVGGGGVQRPVKFVKYLRDFGWEPIVLSVANPSVPVLDASLLKDIPDGVKVYRARTLEPSYALKSRVSRTTPGQVSRMVGFFKKAISCLLLPDMQVLWWPGLFLQLSKIIMLEKPNVILVSAPPFSSFVPTVFVGTIFKVPVVLDYRDEWSFTRQNWENSVKTSFAEKLDTLLEAYALRKCSAFVTANQSYVDSIYRMYPGLDRSKGRVITNGYDTEDLAEGKALPRHKEKVRIIYAGTVWSATSLQTFIKALEMLFDSDDSGINRQVFLDIYGRVVDEERRYLDESKYAHVIGIHGYSAHQSIMGELLNSDILLLTLSDLPGAERIITAKAFEYMATGKHILAIAPLGETSDLLRQNYGNLSLINSSDPNEVFLALKKIVASIEQLRMREGDVVTQFTRRNLTGTLCEVFDALSARGFV